ncbi:hypothetical protein ACQPXH_11505 [Nocardia sp. CA-135953]|uniref:hypothetical protein n=1 Tax=Nocardia sp. CA-135953 TaxID=3239978 RepID=UPI003D9767AF
MSSTSRGGRDESGRRLAWDYTHYSYCEYCDTEDAIGSGPHCTYCGFCDDCYQPFPHCQCPDVAGRERYAGLLDMETA